MANLNIPFLFMQENNQEFTIDSKASRIIQEPELFSGKIQTYQTQQFEQKLPKLSNMMIVSDKSNGMITLCTQDSVATTDSKTNDPLNFIVNVKPRIMCLPDSFPESLNIKGKDGNQADYFYKLIDFCFIQSPASKLLSTSDYLLVTLHHHGPSNRSIVKLWNKDDGRCIMTSPKEVFWNQRIIRIINLDDQFFTGLILCLTEDGFMQIINVFTMISLKRIHIGFDGLQQLQVLRNEIIIQITFVDRNGKIQVWSTNKNHILVDYEASVGQLSNQKMRKQQIGKNTKQVSNLQLNQCNFLHHKASAEQKIMLSQLDFTLKHEATASSTWTNLERFPNRGEHTKIIGMHRKLIDGIHNFLIVYQDRIELVQKETKSVVVQYEQEIQKDDGYNLIKFVAQEQEKQNWFISCQFRKLYSKHYIFCVDSEFNLVVYDVEGLFMETMKAPIMKLNLFKQAKLFHYQVQDKDPEHFGMTKSEINQEVLDKHYESMQKNLEETVFNFEQNQYILYAYSKCDNKQYLISWSFQSILLHIRAKTHDKVTQIAANISEIHPMGQKNQDSVININPYIAQNYFSKYQHSFFYPNEKVTEQTFFVSAEFPSVILGTTHGRIFIVQLFQDIEGRPFPVIVIDAHDSMPISQLYVAYSPARKIKTPGMGPQQSVAQDTGGHLIAGSEDGTISITDLHSLEISEQLGNFTVLRDEPERERADRFMSNKMNNLKRKRRHSFSGDISFQHYFNLVQIKPLKVYPNCSLGPIDRVVEVQVLQNIQFELQRYLQQTVNEPSKPGPISKSESMTDIMNSTNLYSQGNLKDENLVRDQADYKHQFNSIEEIKANEEYSFGQRQPHTFKDLNIPEILAIPNQQPIFNEIMPFKSHYACIDDTSFAAYVLSIENNKCDLIKIQGLDSQPIGVYEDALQNLIHLITDESLTVYTYSRGSKQLLRKSSYVYAMEILQFNHQLITMTELQQHFRMAIKLKRQVGDEADEYASEDYDQFSFRQQFNSETIHKKSGGSASASGQHKVLDYLSLSLSLPLYYHPHSIFSQKFTKSVKDLLPRLSEFRDHLDLSPDQPRSEIDVEGSQEVLRTMIKAHFVWSNRYKSDFSQDFYQAQGAITPIVTGSGDKSDSSVKQQMLIINTKDMLNIFKSRMKALQDSLVQLQKKGENNHPTYLDSQAEGESNADAPQAPDISAAYFQNSRWPTRLLSLVHPFKLDLNLDENLELFFGLSIPFLDFRIGVQGIDESFSFVLRQEERSSTSLQDEFDQIAPLQSEELLYLLKSSKIRRLQIEHKFSEEQIQSSQTNKMKFLNGEYWRASSYMNTVMSSFFLSTLVSIVEYAQTDITTLLQDWLNVVQFITSVNSITDSNEGNNLADSQKLQKLLETMECLAKPLSVSVISQLMLRKDHSISSCARDMLMKPLMNSGSSIEYIKAEINEWQDLIMDTYLKLKEDSNRQAQLATVARATSGIPRVQSSELMNAGALQIPHRGSDNKASSPAQNRSAVGNIVPSRPTLTIEPIQEGPSINHFFGELEIRGLVNLSQFALWSMDGDQKYRIDTDVQNRLCKCTVILTREIMTKFTQNSKEHQTLLTILMQLLQTQMRARVPTFQTKVIKEDVIKILLRIYDFYKKQLRDEKFLTKVVAENFHLIHPKNSELYLKLTAAKTLLEVGTYFTDDFLKLIHEQATTLREGPEYQKNVLDVLRYFISCSRDTLDSFLIQIVQTLLRCLDPNDEQLRKNSTTPISHILSIMVKSFPLIAFHHDNQRLAVGTPSGPIAIYDIKTSQKWKVLEGHGKKVSCCEFDLKGNLLASYSADESSLRIWKAGNAGFFSTIMGGTGKSYKEYKLESLNKQNEPEIQIPGQRAKTRLVQVRVPQLKAQTQSETKCKIRFVNSDKTIELTRENGKKEFHQLTR